MGVYRFFDRVIDPQRNPWGVERVEYALEFNGSDSRVLIPNNAAINLTGSMTIELWCKTYASDFGRLLGKRLNSSDDGFLIYYSGGSRDAITWWYNTGICRHDTTNFTVQQKSHIAFIYDLPNTRLQYFLEGGLAEQENGVSPLSHNDGDLEIGAEVEKDAYFSGGLIYQVRMWDKVLSLSEIQRNMTNYYISGSADNLVGYWPMNEGKGSIVYDYSGNGNNGTIENAIWKKAT